MAASDPEDECVEIEENQPKRQAAEISQRALSAQLGTAVSSLDTTTKAMTDMVTLFQQHSGEVSQVATQLGLTGVSNK